MTDWREEPIGKHHDRKTFDCGDADFNDFLQRYARQSHDQGGSKTCLAINDADCTSIVGFYSLAPTSIDPDKVPDTVGRGLGRHELPGFRLTHLAVDKRLQGRGIGGQLLLAAGKRWLRAASEVGGLVMAIDAKNDKVAEWYRNHGALPLTDRPKSLVIPLTTIAAALTVSGMAFNHLNDGRQPEHLRPIAKG